MGNFLTVCTTGDIQYSRVTLLKEEKVLQIMKIDGKILEFRRPLLVRDLLLSHPNCYVGMFKEATQPLPLDHKLKIGKVYYLLPCLDTSSSVQSDASGKTDQKAKTVKVVITKEQLQQLLSEQGRVEELLLGIVPKSSVCTSDASSSAWLPKLESIPEGSDVVC